MDDSSLAIAEALGAWGIVLWLEQRLDGGGVNEHWRIDVPSGPSRVLRRYHPRHDPAGTAFEHDVLAFLAAEGWPVAAPLPAADGRSVVETAAGRWSLFPLMVGEPAPDTPLFLQRRGAVLALLHDDLAQLATSEQRPGSARVDDVDACVRPEGHGSLDALLEWWSREDPVRAHALGGLSARSAEQLAALGYAEFPGAVVTYACTHDHVLFQGDDVTGLLGFADVRRDARIADIAHSLVVDCGIDEARLRAWLTGYAAHARPGLSAAEVALLPPVMLATALRRAVIALSIASRRPAADLLDGVRDAVDRRLPALEAAQSDLRSVLRAGAGYPA